MAIFLIADDHPLFRDALTTALKRGFPRDRILTSDSITTTKELIETDGEPDLLLLDLNMPGSDGFFGLIHLRECYASVPIVVISAMEDPLVIQRALAYGASGFIPKSCPAEQIIEAINAVLEGDCWVPAAIKAELERLPLEEKDFSDRVATLTDQQFKVLMHLTEGRLNKQIAYDLNISEATVKAHITAIFRKLGVQNRTQAVIAASKLKLPENTGAF
ncbi:response regulator transcription factor [Gynuella sunshinyii]|uniref:Response regulator containing a CheY-like receiver domain and an HTH DNA-binding domain n=1 Tax=Gynuella sunshinyii YC6258 TaxID=1445510 RepID=A0A0C5VRL4_9GAMM|nr:response regulator transcription factor [Gynuella sunshinyii]AJQ96881.1 response regulator containing a CheY-like receiver domain and an HTH DNA-binding domain [Gynuella sunshinyii YC6258]